MKKPGPYWEDDLVIRSLVAFLVIVGLGYIGIWAGILIWL
jgi:hypothetical protein